MEKLTSQQKKQIQDLKRDLAIFEAYAKQIDRQQIKFPMDSSSRKVISKDVPVPTGAIAFPANLVTYDMSMEVDLNGKKYHILSTSEYVTQP